MNFKTSLILFAISSFVVFPFFPIQLAYTCGGDGLGGASICRDRTFFGGFRILSSFLGGWEIWFFNEALIMAVGGTVFFALLVVFGYGLVRRMRPSAFGVVLGALFMPFVVGLGVEMVAEVENVTITILLTVLWLLATIGLGVRVGTWRALYFAVLPAGVLLPLFLVGSGGKDAFGWAVMIALTLIWLVGITIGVYLQKVVSRRSQTNGSGPARGELVEA